MSPFISYVDLLSSTPPILLSSGFHFFGGKGLSYVKELYWIPHPCNGQVQQIPCLLVLSSLKASNLHFVVYIRYICASIRQAASTRSRNCLLIDVSALPCPPCLWQGQVHVLLHAPHKPSWQPQLAYVSALPHRAVRGCMHHAMYCGMHSRSMTAMIAALAVLISRAILEWCTVKILLGVQIYTSTLDVLAEFGKYPLKIAWQAQAAKCLPHLESMDDNGTLKQAFVADRRLPKSWSFQLEAQLRDVSVNVPTTDGHSHRCFSIQSAKSAHLAQLSSSTSIKAATCRDVVWVWMRAIHTAAQQQASRTNRCAVLYGVHWLNIETGCHKKVDRSGRTCPMSVGRISNPDAPADCFDADEDAPDPIEDEHHAVFECSGYASTRQMFFRSFPQPCVHCQPVSEPA